MPTYLRACREKDPKHVYYLSAEFLMGRTLTNAVHNLGLEGDYGKVRAAVPCPVPSIPTLSPCLSVHAVCLGVHASF